MSEFVNRLKRVSRDDLKSMGFTSKKVSVEVKPLILALLDEKMMEQGPDYLNGADAGLISLADPSLGSKILDRAIQFDLKIPWGGWLQKLDGTTLKQVVTANYDFLIFPSDTPVTFFLENEPGRIIELSSTTSGSEQKVISSLPLDAVLINDEFGHNSLTWRHLMLYQGFAEAITKPLIITVAFNATSEELQLLWRAGVDGLLINGLTDQPDKLTKLRQIINDTTFSLKDRWGKSLPFLPSMGGYGRLDAEEE